MSWKMSRSDLLGLLAMIVTDLILDELVGVSDLVLDLAFLCSAFWSFSVLPLDGRPATKCYACKGIVGSQA